MDLRMLYGDLKAATWRIKVIKVTPAYRPCPPALDGTRGEMAIYEAIMAAYTRTTSRGGDPVTIGSRLARCLAKLMKEGGKASAGTATNGILLLLRLFFLRDDQTGEQGEDIEAMDDHDRQNILAELRDALPDD